MALLTLLYAIAANCYDGMLIWIGAKWRFPMARRVLENLDRRSRMLFMAPIEAATRRLQGL